jgi:hypothetical protein
MLLSYKMVSANIYAFLLNLTNTSLRHASVIPTFTILLQLLLPIPNKSGDAVRQAQNALRKKKKERKKERRNIKLCAHMGSKQVASVTQTSLTSLSRVDQLLLQY